jgi:poly-gamma-glutamate system protein
MIKIYWRPRQVSRTALVLISLLSLAGFASVELLQRQSQQPFYREKLNAAHLTAEAFTALKAERLKRKLRINADSDPASSGLIGELMTPVTSNTGNLHAKQLSVNPNFAAVIVHYLKRAGVEEGDVVAVGLSGSFPALNVATLCALEALKVQPIVISSVAASQWGANEPKFLWVEWEKLLFDKRLLSFRSHAASIGGIEDRGLGMTAEGRRVIVAAIEQAEVPLLYPRNYEESIEQRMALYRDLAKDKPVKAYINVGGGTTSVGTKVGKKLFRPGLNLRAPEGGPAIDSVMNRFADQGVPVIHLVNIAKLAKRFGFSPNPRQLPPVGQGKVFSREEYNLWLAGGFLLAIFAALYAFVRSDLGFRIMQLSRRGKSRGHPEPMV